MRPSESLNARHLLVNARVVFHGARAERIEAEIDGVILGGEAREMTDGFDFADFGEIRNFGARVFGAEHGSGIDGRNIERRPLVTTFSGGAALKQQRLGLVYVRADFLDHAVRTSATASISSRRDISVTHSSMVLSSSG